MVLNLLENAIRHTPAGTSDLAARRQRGGDRAKLVVADDGPGLPEGMEDQVFDRFVRGEGPADRSSANGTGTGLGLSIVRAVAVAHGGRVVADRSKRGGARFTVTLPLAVEPDDEGNEFSANTSAAVEERFRRRVEYSRRTRQQRTRPLPHSGRGAFDWPSLSQFRGPPVLPSLSRRATRTSFGGGRSRRSSELSCSTRRSAGPGAEALQGHGDRLVQRAHGARCSPGRSAT